MVGVVDNQTTPQYKKKKPKIEIQIHTLINFSKIGGRITTIKIQQLIH